MKKTISECAEFVLLDSLAISCDFRGKGYGRLLLGEAVSAIKGAWPHISRIELNVSQDNAAGIALYESEG